ncbi:MAG: response regulator [Candidatus Nealsonbacteria bacterium]
MEKFILLVEDDPFLIDIYSIKLKEEGFLVEVISDGEQVLPKIKKKKPDLVVLDIVLPKVDGWEILHQIKTDHEIKNTKVIIISNLGQKEEVQKGIELGASKYLIKAHFTPGQVVEEIKKTI